VFGQAVFCCQLLHQFSINLSVNAPGDFDAVLPGVGGCCAFGGFSEADQLAHLVLQLAPVFDRCSLRFFGRSPSCGQCIQFGRNHSLPPIFAMIAPRSGASHVASLPLRSLAAHKPSESHISARWVLPSPSFSTRKASTSSKK